MTDDRNLALIEALCGDADAKPSDHPLADDFAAILAAAQQRQHGPKPALRPRPARRLALPLLSGLAAALLLLALLPGLLPTTHPSQTPDPSLASEVFTGQRTDRLRQRIDALRERPSPILDRPVFTTDTGPTEPRRIQFQLRPLTF